MSGCQGTYGDGPGRLELEARSFRLFYGDFEALKGLSISFASNSITAVIGPSGCGKSTFLRSINRMNDLIPEVRTEGEILFGGVNVYHPGVDLTWLRSRIGMVFQRPAVFPLSIFDNVASAPRVQGIKSVPELQDIVERSLRAVGLWEEVRGRMKGPAQDLSLGNQQKLCIARAIATSPEVILLDEPCSALDPVATLKIEELMWKLRDDFTLIIVTHSMQQASRASDYVVFMLDGSIVEQGPTKEVFTNPKSPATEGYITGRL